jgi:hypothetical protein
MNLIQSLLQAGISLKRCVVHGNFIMLLVGSQQEAETIRDSIIAEMSLGEVEGIDLEPCRNGYGVEVYFSRALPTVMYEEFQEE